MSNPNPYHHVFTDEERAKGRGKNKLSKTEGNKLLSVLLPVSEHKEILRRGGSTYIRKLVREARESY